MIDPAVPPLPPTVADWEELLLRWELGPRAATHLLEETAPARWPAAAAAGWSLAAHVAHLADREEIVARWLLALRDGAVLESLPQNGPPPAAPADLQAELDRWAAIRSRNFNVLQRRGVDVWHWSATTPAGEPISAYRLVTELLRHDTRHLTRMRLLAGASNPFAGRAGRVDAP